MSILENYRQIQKRIEDACERTGRSSGSVRILAVSKYVDDQAVQAAIGLGITAFGENRIQDLRHRLTKFPDLEWHFIGSLQTNKVKYCRSLSMIHSLDRWRLAVALNEAAAQWGTPKEVLIQVNISGEISKHGMEPGSVPEFAVEAKQALPYLRIRGLMTMAPHYSDPEMTRPIFRALRKLSVDVGELTGQPLDVLSMGMSNDFEVAVEEGATLVRIGSTLFGEEG